MTEERGRANKILKLVNDVYTLSTITILMPIAIRTPTAPGGIKSYYQAKIEAAELTINQKTQNLRRLEAQRNALNARGEFIWSDGWDFAHWTMDFQ